MLGTDIYIGGGLSYNKKDGSFMNWDNKNSSCVIFHRSSICSIESYNKVKSENKHFTNERGFGVLFKSNTGNIILNLKLDSEKELREIVTKLSDPELEIFKNHNTLTEENILWILTELKNNLVN